jgi:hypothetical protein
MPILRKQFCRFLGLFFFIKSVIYIFFMETSASRELLADLFEEYSLWYSILAGEYGTLPRSISGVAEDGRQFIYLLDGLELHHMVRNKFIRFVLEEMQSVAYAYGSLDIRGESDEGELVELLDVVAADMERYITGSWQVIRGQDGRVTDLLHRGTREGRDTEKHPGSWFLAGSVRFSEVEKARYGVIWQEAKSEVIFKDRNAAD